MSRFSGIYGIGQGMAQVFGDNSVLRQLEQNELITAKRRQKEDADLNADLSKVNYNGARKEDLPVLVEGYDEVKQSFAKYRNARTNKERIEAGAEYDQKKAEFTQKVAASKTAIQGIGEVDKLRLTKPDDLADDFSDRFKKLNSTSTFDPNFQKYSEDLISKAFRPKFDEEKYFKEKTPLFVQKVEAGEVKTRNIPGFGKQAYTESGTMLNRDQFVKNIYKEAVSNKGLLATIKGYYPQDTITDAVFKYSNQRADMAEQQHGLKETIQMEVQNEKPKTAHQKEMERLGWARLAKSGSDDVAESDYEVERVELLSNIKNDANDNPIKGSQTKIVFDKSIKVRSPNFPSTQIAEAYSISQGKTVTVTDTDDLQDLKLVRIGWTPAKSGGYKLKAVLAGKNGQYITDEGEIPIDVRKSKAYGTAKRALGEAPGQGKPVTNTPPKANEKLATPSKREIKSSDIAGYAKAAGYTVDEYKKMLIKNGVKIN